VILSKYFALVFLYFPHFSPMNRSLSSSIFCVFAFFFPFNLASAGGVFEKHQIGLAEGVSCFMLSSGNLQQAGRPNSYS